MTLTGWSTRYKLAVVQQGAGPGDALKLIGTHGIADQEVGDIALLVEPS